MKSNVNKNILYLILTFNIVISYFPSYAGEIGDYYSNTQGNTWVYKETGSNSLGETWELTNTDYILGYETVSYPSTDYTGYKGYDIKDYEYYNVNQLTSQGLEAIKFYNGGNDTYSLFGGENSTFPDGPYLQFPITGDIHDTYEVNYREYEHDVSGNIVNTFDVYRQYEYMEFIPRIRTIGGVYSNCFYVRGYEVKEQSDGLYSQESISHMYFKEGIGMVKQTYHYERLDDADQVVFTSDFIQDLVRAKVDETYYGKPEYPVVFIHGLASSAMTWEDTGVTAFLDSQGWDFGGALLPTLTDPLLADIDESDVGLAITNPDGDYFLINFVPNDSGIAKQGKALEVALDILEQQTGSEKFILVGHSMGGLAARDYVQSWAYDSYDNVARLVTIGTPNYGTLFANSPTAIEAVTGLDGTSDAVRDMRDDAVYLFGGNEADIDSAYFGDVNYNNSFTDDIIGLNSESFPVDIDYISMFCNSAYYDPVSDSMVSLGSDLVVPVASQKMPIGNNIELPSNLDHFSEPTAYAELMKALGYQYPLTVYAGSPVDLVIKDPTGMTIDKNNFADMGAFYFEYDFDGDGVLDPQLTILNPLYGDYSIQVVGREGASPFDTYTLGTRFSGTNNIIAQDVMLQDIPEEAYYFNYTETVIPEPSTMLLLGFGLLGAGLLKRKRS